MRRDRYDFAPLRKSMRETFTAQTLLKFCARDPRFQAIERQVKSNPSLDEVIDTLFTYCEAHVLVSDLEAAVEEYRSKAQEPPYTDKGFTIVARVIQQEGYCAAGHQVGDTVVFDGQTVQGKVCIHALYSFLPKVFAMRYGAEFPWLEDKDVATHACPDAWNPVVFEIRRVRE